MKPEDDNFLTQFGMETMKRLGIRMWSRLGELISNTRTINQVKVQSTDIPRTKQSADKYLEGIFGSWPNKPRVETVPELQDYLLKFPDLCEKYIFVNQFKPFKKSKDFKRFSYNQRKLITVKTLAQKYLNSRLYPDS